MRALTIKQPWASAIAAGIKRVENRTWPPPARLIGQRIAIHAGKATDPEGIAFCRQLGWEPPVDLPKGVIIATAIIDRVIDESDDPWFQGPLGWVLRDIEIIEPVSCNGKLGLWPIPDA